jgi:hypothetical protein
MKREEMVCSKCLNFNDGACFLNPKPILLSGLYVDVDKHWCAQGQWAEVVEEDRDWKSPTGSTQLVRVRLRVVRRWGEWDAEPKTK